MGLHGRVVDVFWNYVHNLKFKNNAFASSFNVEFYEIN